MRQVYTRPYDPKNRAEVKKFADWLYEQRALNKFNPDLLRKGQLEVFTVFDDTGIIGFVSKSSVYFLNHWAFRPDLTPQRKSQALRSIQHHFVGKAAAENVPDIYFHPSDEHFADVITKQFKWSEVKDRLLHLRFADLEGKDETVS
jgi:hypothetical protein